MNTQTDFTQKRREAIHKINKEEIAFNFLASKNLVSENVIYYDHTHGFGFGWRKPVTLAEARNILASLPAMQNNAELTVSYKPVETFSPFLLKIDNYDHANTIKIEYQSTSGYKINIEVQKGEYSPELLWRITKNLKHKGFGRYETKSIYKLHGFGSVDWSGDGQTAYASTQEEKENFEYAIFNGSQPV